MSGPCDTCGKPHSPFGIGPPLLRQERWYCASCIPLQPASQFTVARQCREVLEDPEVVEPPIQIRRRTHEQDQ